MLLGHLWAFLLFLRLERKMKWLELWNLVIWFLFVDLEFLVMALLFRQYVGVIQLLWSIRLSNLVDSLISQILLFLINFKFQSMISFLELISRVFKYIEESFICSYIPLLCCKLHLSPNLPKSVKALRGSSPK